MAPSISQRISAASAPAATAVEGLDAACAVVCEAWQATSVTIWVIDGDARTTTPVAGHPRPRLDPAISAAWSSIALDAFPDVSALGERLADHLGVSSLRVVPLPSPRVSGLMLVGPVSSIPPDELDEVATMMALLAGEAFGVASAAARTATSLRRQLRRATAGRELLERAASSTTVEEVTLALASVVETALQTDATATLTPEQVADEPVLGSLHAGPGPLLVPSGVDPKPFDADLLPDVAITAIAALPVWSAGSIHGAVVTARTRPDTRWSAEDRETAIDLTRLASVMADVVLLRTSEERHAERLAELLSVEIESVRRLEQVGEMKDAFLSAVSHELRTPLTVIRGIATTLQRRRSDLELEMVDRLTDRLVANTLRLERMLLDLLDLDRLSRQDLEAERTAVDMVRLIIDAADEADLQQHVLELPSGKVSALVDRVQVERLVGNLLVNAGKYTPPGSTVSVGLSVSGRDLLLHVDDDGPGVPEAKREDIFEPFHRGDDHHPSPGTGVGLSLVRQFARLHGGDAWVTTSPRGGASFRVTLPESIPDGI